MRAPFCLVRDLSFLEHSPEFEHPENPYRLKPLLSQLEEPEFQKIPGLTPKPATETDLLRVHSQDLIEKLKETGSRTGWLDPDTYYTPESLETALLAAGSSIELALKIWRKEFTRGFTLVRPPGHHATPKKSMGFCLLNNVALAVAAVLEEAPHARVAIVDFDLHHGNGTQDAFFENPNVLFLSSHRYPFYPGSGGFGEVGAGKGVGTNVCLPISKPEGDFFFQSLYENLVGPVLEEFKPDMIFVSAGFDGHRLDPMCGFQMEEKTFLAITELLIRVAEKNGGRLFLALEGGYHPEALASSALSVIRRLASEKKTETTRNVDPKIVPYLSFHRNYFPSLLVP